MKNSANLFKVSLASNVALGFGPVPVLLKRGDRVNAELQRAPAVGEMRQVGVPALAGLSANGIFLPNLPQVSKEPCSHLALSSTVFSFGRFCWSPAFRWSHWYATDGLRPDKSGTPTGHKPHREPNKNTVHYRGAQINFR